LRDKIIQAAMEQIKKFGFRKFTIDDIAADLGISKKTVYKYFDSKNQIISAVVDAHMEMEKARTIEAMQTEGGWIEKFKEVVFCDNHEKVPNWLLEELQRFFPEEWAKADAIGEFKCEHVKKLLATGKEKGDIRDDLHPAIIGLTLDKTIDALFDYKFLNQHGLTISQAMEQVKNIILYGILKRE